jgi:hypothetical protein
MQSVVRFHCQFQKVTFNNKKIDLFKQYFNILYFDFLNISNEQVRTELNKWQMDFSARPVELDGRVLPCESLMFGKVSNIDEF